MTELAKTFEPGPIEARWYAHWEGQGLFRPERPDAEPFTIVMPPPNVTGSLHIGHALDNTLQDVLIRHARMQGKDSLWVVGMDHAGIATQMVVERNLDSQGLKRADIGRDAFLEHVWEWKAQSGGQITRQLRRLGASCDWANERFTMDEGFSKARSSRCSSSSTSASCSIATSGWSTGTPSSRRRSATSRSRTAKCRAISGTSNIRSRTARPTLTSRRTKTGTSSSGRARLYLDRHHPAGDDARPTCAVAVHPGRRALSAARRQAVRASGRTEEHRRLIPIITDDHPDPEFRLGRGQDHRGARPQRLWRGAAQRHPDVPADGRHRAHAQRRSVLCQVRGARRGDRTRCEGQPGGRRRAQSRARGLSRPRPLRCAQGGGGRHRCRRR